MQIPALTAHKLLLLGAAGTGGVSSRCREGEGRLSGSLSPAPHPLLLGPGAAAFGPWPLLLPGERGRRPAWLLGALLLPATPGLFRALPPTKLALGPVSPVFNTLGSHLAAHILSNFHLSSGNVPSALLGSIPDPLQPLAFQGSLFLGGKRSLMTSFHPNFRANARGPPCPTSATFTSQPCSTGDTSSSLVSQA